MGKPFIKVKLHSGTGGESLGEKDLVVYYECAPSVKNINDSNIISYDDVLLEWVNTHDYFQRGYFNEDFEFDSPDTLKLVYLNDDEIKKVREAGHLIREDDLIRP